MKELAEKMNVKGVVWCVVVWCGVVWCGVVLMRCFAAGWSERGEGQCVCVLPPVSRLTLVLGSVHSPPLTTAHFVSNLSTAALTPLSSAGDVEGHVSRRDGRFYLIDLARHIAPVPPRPHTADHLWKQFRPELLRMKVTPVGGGEGLGGTGVGLCCGVLWCVVVCADLCLLSCSLVLLVCAVLCCAVAVLCCAVLWLWLCCAVPALHSRCHPTRFRVGACTTPNSTTQRWRRRTECCAPNSYPSSPAFWCALRCCRPSANRRARSHALAPLPLPPLLCRRRTAAQRLWCCPGSTL
jgi:hypothetical protein